MTLRQTTARRAAMVCHRGANRIAPENTLAAACAAFDLGAEYVEIDVRTSADGGLFVLHDPTVDRTTDGRGPIVEKSSDDIVGLDAGFWFNRRFRGEPVPELRQMLRLALGRGGLYIEIQAADPAGVVAMARTYGDLANCLFWSRDPDMRDALGAIPGLARVIRFKDYSDAEAAIASHQPAIMEFEVSEIEANTLALCARHHVQAMAYYPGSDPDVFLRLIARGVQLINLDEPEAYLAALRATGA